MAKKILLGKFGQSYEPSIVLHLTCRSFFLNKYRTFFTEILSQYYYLSLMIKIFSKFIFEKEKFWVGKSRQPWAVVCLGPIYNKYRTFFTEILSQYYYLSLMINIFSKFLFKKEQKFWVGKSRQPWANRLFSKSIKGKILTLFSRDKSKFFIQSFTLLKLAKLNFYF